MGDRQHYTLRVQPADFAQFPDEGLIHPVLSTFSLTKYAEWASRLFVLDMLEAGEQGIGSKVTVNHRSPALEGNTVVITATLTAVDGNRVVCDWVANVDERIIADGMTEQHVLEHARFVRSLDKLR